MTTGDKILQDISNYKAQAMALGLKYINLSKNGENLGCKENKLSIIVGKIDALERFYNNNFDATGSQIDPIYVCPEVTLIRKYIDPNYVIPENGIEINIIDGGTS